jgi:nitroreductase
MHQPPITSEALLQQLRWRYATKMFDPIRRIPPAEWSALEEALVLTPSSYGLQPWKFVVVEDPRLRERLRSASWNQRQVVECSHFIVLATRKPFGTAEVDHLIRRTAEVRSVPPASLETYRRMMQNDIVNGPRGAAVNEWARLQVYIALGNLMTCAALLGIDTCPMEGLDPQQYDEILALPQRGLATTVACAVGYRAADDRYATLAKVRFSLVEVIEHV